MMNFRFLSSSMRKNDKFKKVLNQIRNRDRVDVFAASPLRPLIVTSIFDELSIPILVVVSNSEESERFADEMRNFLPSLKTKVLPDWEILPHERISPSKEISCKRIEVLSQIRDGEPMIVVATVQTFMQNLPFIDPSFLKPIRLEVGTEVDFRGALTRLVELGYERVPKVEAKGDFSVRGGIIDIYAPNLDSPFRIEFYGDTIESIRSFDLLTQLSISKKKVLTVLPCREVFLSSNDVKRVIASLETLPEKPDWLLEDVEHLKTYGHFEGIERYTPFFADEFKTILDYLPSNGLLIFDEEKKLDDEAVSFFKKQLSYLDDSILAGEFINPPKPYYLPFEEVKKKDVKRLNIFTVQSSQSEIAVHFSSSPIEPMLGQLDKLKESLDKFIDADLAVVITVRDEGRAERLAEIICKWGFETINQPASLTYDKVSFVVADFQEGFFFPDLKLVVLTESDIFIKPRRFRRDKQTVTGKPTISLSDINAGDYVVHEDQGIGKFTGMTVQEVEGIKRDYLLLVFAGGDKLYVPLDQMNRITKYIGVGTGSPKLNKLGSLEWPRVKKRAQGSVKKLAIDLLNLYAHRMKTKGYAYSKDTVWQKELEGAFPFDETPDQLRAVNEVKEDMERARPADRLVCGDVGYGKTEVALRATFKAIMDGKQVLILVPTTILAQQHFNTFCERFSSYPINVEVLSRFRTSREQKVIIEGLKKGNTDVVIGTHRLLQKDVHVRDLGLVIIDEEQRFGVAHKEHLKELRKMVDVLTLSATPIPRTLQMSLSGVRDLSVINTPPEDRYPILTKVAQYNEKMIQDAIHREINRGGQVYYVHNEVKTIYRVAKELEELVPETRIAVGHGQMKVRDLEKVMLDFLAKKFDVLLCTTIIESGIDIPTVNTLIVDEADKFGLAQMYQLRGRVGRSHHRAYAYFLFSSKKPLTTTAFSRLKTISEFTELGSGIKIAMRDLEIRGAGNLLGPEQHGQIATVGFELYNRFLRKAVEEIRGELLYEEPIDVKIDMPVDAFIPHDYIEDEALRIEAYQIIAFARDLKAIEDARNNLRDRFGQLPLPVRNLIEIAKLKVVADKIGLRSIIYDKKKLILKDISLTEKQISILKDKYKDLIYKSQMKVVVIQNLLEENILFFLRNLFDDIIRTCKNSIK